MNAKKWTCVALATAIIAVGTAQATTYTWTQTALGIQDWTAGANWSNSTVYVSGSDNELRFFADSTTGLDSSRGTQTITNVPAALSLNTLTLNGKGPNAPIGFTVIIGDNASTWTIGDGSISLVNLNATVWSNSRDVRYLIVPNLTLNQATTTFTGGGTSARGFIFSGNITEAGAGYGVTKSGASFLTFSGTNTYTGPTTVTGGALAIGNAASLPAASALTLNGGLLELNGFNFNRSLGSGTNQFQITGGSSGFGARVSPVVVTVNNDAGTELVWGNASFRPSTLVLNRADYHTETAGDPSFPQANMLILRNTLDLNAATRTIQVDAGVAVLPNDIRTASGTAGLTKSGGGTLVLTGNNTYNGTTTITGGTLSIGSASNLGGASANLIFTSGTLQITGTALTSLDSGLGRTVTINSGNKGFDIQDAANTFTVDKVLTGTGTFTKSGAGTLVLNQDNTFNNTTTVTGGGTLVLDYSTNGGSKLENTKALTLSGTRLVLKGSNHTEVVSGTTLNTYTSSSISRDGGTSTISLGGLSLNNNSTLAISGSNIARTTTANATVSNPSGGILPAGRITVGSHFGANDGSGDIVAYSGYNAVTTAGGSATTWVNELTGGGTMAATLSSYALRIVNSGNSDVLDINNKNLNLVNNSTILYAGGFDNQYTINGTGALTSNSGNQYFNINVYSGCTLIVNAKLSGNGAPVSKSGEGTLILGGNNSAGVSVSTIYVQEGVLRLTNSLALGGTSAGTIVLGGAALELANNIAIGVEPLTLSGAGISNGGALRNVSGNNSLGGAITLGGGGARINADSGTSLTLTGGIITSGGQVLSFGGAGDITVRTPGIQGAANLVKDGTGTLELAVTNSAVQSTCGDMTLNASTLQLTYTVAPSATVAPIKIFGNLIFNGTPTIKISATEGLFTSGVTYPLLQVGGTAPATLPDVEVTGVTGTLKWENNTLVLAPLPAGTLIYVK